MMINYIIIISYNTVLFCQKQTALVLLYNNCVLSDVCVSEGGGVCNECNIYKYLNCGSGMPCFSPIHVI